MGFHVLLVEPDGGLADEIRRAFDPLGFSVTALQAGEPAVERCRQEPPDLILLAAELPDMSGFSVCNRLKRALATVPLILYTAEATEAAVEAHRSTRSRADDYLRKPFDVAELLGRAAALLNAVAPEMPTPAAPPTPPRPDGHRAQPEASEPPPVLQRVESGQIAARGLAAALAAASAPAPGGPAAPAAPPGSRTAPPPVPAQRTQAPLGRVKVVGAADARDPFAVLAEWPRDPAPPKGTPEEKLEYFRERLRTRDAFLARIREASAGMKAVAAELAGERDVLQHALDAERERAAALEQRLQEASQDAAAQSVRIDDLRRQLEESETTRQSLSDVLSETIQQAEAAEQGWSARIGAADADRARLEGELAERGEAHARAVAALEADRAEERALAETARLEADAAHTRALAETIDSREREREEADAKLALAEERITALGVERDEAAAEVRRLEAALRAGEEAASLARSDAAAEADALRARIEEAEGRTGAVAGELAAAEGRIHALEEELRRGADARATLEEELRQARAETQAYEEKAVAAEHAFHAKVAELEAAEQRIGELSASLDEGRATAEGTLQRVDAARADAERRAAQAAAERDQLGRKVEGAQRAAEAARAAAQAERERGARLESEVARLARLEPVAEEAARLRKEVSSLRDLVQQRTQTAESASRAAQAAAAERARADERLAVEGGRLQAQAARLESELATARRRVEELERAGADREAALRKAAADAEGRRRNQSAEAAEAERKHAAEAARLRAAMVDLERHLEARARAELQLKRRVQDLERAAQGARPPPIPDAGELAKAKERLAKLAEEAEELKGENDFLNGEVARYQQKNKDLAAQLASLRES
jgi:CheY-like chemotaxis protein